MDLASFYADVVNTYSNAGLMEVTGDFLTNYYSGLSDIATEQRVIYMSMMTMSSFEVALVQVSNSSDVAAVKDIFQARIDNMVGTDENPGAAWYPAAIELWDTHSQIVTNGNYVMLIVSENDADIVSDFNALF